LIEPGVIISSLIKDLNCRFKGLYGNNSKQKVFVPSEIINMQNNASYPLSSCDLKALQFCEFRSRRLSNDIIYQIRGSAKKHSQLEKGKKISPWITEFISMSFKSKG
jgi:hypothetical protein